MNWHVPLFDPDLGPEEEQALIDVIRSKWLTMGDRTKEFERRFAAELDVPVALACNSATAALHMALAVLDVGPGDDVVVPSLTFVATANAVRTGQPRVLRGAELSIDALIASECLPQTAQAVTIEGEPYWDGGFTRNPALRPLI